MSSNLQSLQSKVDSHFTDVHGKFFMHFQCRSGCSACCNQTLSLFPVEMARVLGAVDSLPQESRARILLRTQAVDDPQSSGDQPCPLLEDDRCTIYAERPIICRSHGLPLQFVDESGQTQRDVCPLNFAGEVPLHTLPDSDLLDLDRLNQMLALVNRLALEELGDTLSEERQNLRKALNAHLNGLSNQE